MPNSSILSWPFLLQIEPIAKQFLSESMAYSLGNLSNFIYDTAPVLLLPRLLQPEITVKSAVKGYSQ